MPGEKIMERRTYAAGRKVFSQGDVGDAAYIVQSGAVGIYRDAGGKRYNLGTMRKSALFGEMAVIDSSPRMATAVVLEHAVLLRVPRDQMINKMNAADPFLRAVVKILLDNLRRTHDIYLQKTKSLEDHVAKLKEDAQDFERHMRFMGLDQESGQMQRYTDLLIQAIDGLETLTREENQVAYRGGLPEFD
ncbi:MAG: Crp/Fnr family transcriptional regulator [Rhodospirillaceae bacterium]